jgi:hypothetical protein
VSISESNDFNYCGTEFIDGCLQIGIKGEKNLGANIGQATDLDRLPAAINKAGAASSNPALNFKMKTVIRDNYDGKAPGVQSKIQSILGWPSVTLVPNFEENAAFLAGYADKNPNSLPRTWEGHLGMNTLQYFEGLATNFEAEGFGSDEMLQEGLAEECIPHTVSMRAFEKLANGTNYHEPLIKNGIL